ncbi:MAG: hypothetical protein HON23_01510 [Rickettsiales bacterium]|jgi:F-type H+-transporting ATPase subunit b|nr:hypothetical protein [Rickettsiales bacterium]
MIVFDEKLWVATAFILFIIFVYKILKNLIVAGLDSKISAIKEDLNRSEQLKAEAEDILKEVRVKEKNLAQDAKKIIVTAGTKIKNLEKLSEEHIAEEIKQKTLSVKKGFQSEKDIFFKQLSQNIVDNVFKAVEAITVKQKAEFIDDYTNKSVEELKQKNL